jgi:hypothetical protein
MRILLWAARRVATKQCPRFHRQSIADTASAKTTNQTDIGGLLFLGGSEGSACALPRVRFEGLAVQDQFSPNRSVAARAAGGRRAPSAWRLLLCANSEISLTLLNRLGQLLTVEQWH